MFPFEKVNLLKEETPPNISVLEASSQAPGIPYTRTHSINGEVHPVSSWLPPEVQTVLICWTKQASNYRSLEKFPSKMRGQSKKEEQLIRNQGQEKLDPKYSAKCPE